MPHRLAAGAFALVVGVGLAGAFAQDTAAPDQNLPSFTTASGETVDIKPNYALQDNALEDVTVEEHRGDILPLDATFQDTNGQTRKLGDFFKGDGKPVVLQLAYFECPMLCDLVSEGMVTSLKGLDESLGSNYSVLTISFNPKEDYRQAQLKQREALKRYGNGGGTGWSFLVGDKPAIDAVTGAVGFKYKYIPESKVYSHPAAIVVCTSDGKISKYLYGVTFDSKTLSEAIATATEGGVGTAGEGFLFTCFQAMKNVGRNTLAAVGVMRLAGIVTVLTLGGMVGLLLLLEKKRHARAALSGNDPV